MQRLLTVLVVSATAVSIVGPARAQVFTPAPFVPTPPPTASAPGCHTADGTGQPATLFAPGDRMVVKGEGFGGVSPIRITFVQRTRTLPVTTSFSDELGVFTADKSQVPDTAAPGPAEFHVFSSTRVATCAVQVMASAGAQTTPKPKHKGSSLVTLWLAALVVFGLFLIVAIIRRWRARRLVSTVSPRDEVPRLAEPPDPMGFGPVRVDETTGLSPLAPPVGGDPERRPFGDEASAGAGTEFTYRDGVWRRDDEPDDAGPHAEAGAYVDVTDASALAEAMQVPPLEKGEGPPLLDPVDSPEVADWQTASPSQVRAEEIRSNGEVSETVARLAEKTKHWPKP